MYSFKRYTHTWEFLNEIPQKIIKSFSNFHETINNWQAELNIEFSSKVSFDFLNFWDLVKIFFNWKIIYAWFILRKEFIYWSEKSLFVSLIWIIDALRYFETTSLKNYVWSISKYDRSYVDWRAATFFEEMFEFLKENESNIFKFDLGKIKDLATDWEDFINWTFIDLLKHYQKYYKMDFFIWADWYLKVWEQKKHKLIFWKDIFEIKIDIDISETFNFVEAKWKFYFKWEVLFDVLKAKDEEKIKKYWVRYKHFWEKMFWVRNEDNREKLWEEMQEYINKILKENSEPKENIKLKIYEKKYFWVLNVLDKITVKNFERDITDKKIVKISYFPDYIELELETYNTLWNILLWQ